MVPSRLFHALWLAFALEMAFLGIALAMIGGRQLAEGYRDTAAAAFVLSLACGGLAIVGEESRRETPFS